MTSSQTTHVALDADEYITTRLKQYQRWYDGNARKAKRKYLSMQSVAVVLGAIVPVLVNVDFDQRELVTTIISLTVVVLVSLEGVLHYREQWKNYRSTEQYLGREEQWFRAGVGPYRQHATDVRAATALLVERAEAAISSENAATLSVMTLGPERSGG